MPNPNEQGSFKIDSNNIPSPGGFSSDGYAVTPEYYDPNSDGLGIQKTYIQYFGEDLDGHATRPLMYDPDDDGTGFVATYIQDFGTTVKDLFNRLRVSEPFTLADIVNRYNVSSKIWHQNIANSGQITHLSNESSIKLSVTSTSGSIASITTIDNFRYQAGKSQVITITAAKCDTSSGVIKRWGYYSDDNGLFFQSSGGMLQIVLRSSVSGTPVDQVFASGGFIQDKMNLQANNNFDINLAKANIYQIEFQWLGAGRADFYVYTDNDTKLLLHSIKSANKNDSVYMSTASLPVRYEIISTGGEADYLKAICQSIISEGGVSPPRNYFSASTASTISITASTKPLISLRPKSTFNSLRNYIDIYPSNVSITCTTNPIKVTITKNATLVGPVWTSADVNSGAEFDITSSALSSGQILFQVVMAANTNLQIDLEKIFDAGRETIIYNNAGIQEIITISAVRLGATNGNADVSINWGEVI